MDTIFLDTAVDLSRDSLHLHLTIPTAVLVAAIGIVGVWLRLRRRG